MAGHSILCAAVGGWPHGRDPDIVREAA
jgi:hypothetical protein